MARASTGRHRLPRNDRGTAGVVGRVLVAVVAAAAVLITGTGWWYVHGTLGGITLSGALADDAPRSTGGAMNILLIGLDSRKDQDGNDLPREILDQLHAGDSEDGGYNTNTLILVHIGADDRVSAFSIPRDDYVAVDDIPGYHHIKIKEAYGLTKAATEQQLVDDGVTDRHELETRGREAGRAATLAAVRNLTGVPIDYFAEVNLAGFYDLASTLGGVKVCLKAPVHDDYSGADFPAGVQTLDAAQALAFVRQRHGLTNGDLDRTHRQQAFLVSVMHQLRDTGTFTDLNKLDGLIAVARKDLVLSRGWGQDQFRRLGALADGDVEYRTLPVVRYDTINGQDVNIVSPPTIRREVAAAFADGASPAPDTGVAVDVVDASGSTDAGTRLAAVLAGHDYRIGAVSTDESAATTSVVDYGAGAARSARALGLLLGVRPASQADPDLGRDRMRVTVADDYTPLETPSAAGTEPLADYSAIPGAIPGAASGATSADTSSAPPTPDEGAPVTNDGIPCVN